MASKNKSIDQFQLCLVAYGKGAPFKLPRHALKLVAPAMREKLFPKRSAVDDILMMATERGVKRNSGRTRSKYGV
jgi:hypothetical protein